jgi:ketosteroid isomerase-like protein
MLEKGWWQGLFDAVDRKDTPRFLAYLAQDGEFRYGNFPAAIGHEAIGAAVNGFFSTIGASRHELLHTWSDGDTAACEGTVLYTRLDGSQVEIPFANVFYLRDGLIARYNIYIDSAPLFAPS